MKKKWIIEEIHGTWWGYLEPRPNDECFITHSRPNKPVIIGPFHCQEYALDIAAKAPIDVMVGS
jgi:hypothetical protein